eukprot:375343_1
MLNRDDEVIFSSVFQTKEYFNLIKSIDCGHEHSLCVDMNGTCYLFGYNDYGQIGNNTKCNEYLEPYQIRSDGSYCDVIDVASCGAQHTLLLSHKNEVIAFGYNGYGQCSPLRKVTFD